MRLLLCTLVGQPRPPISPDQVRIYLEPPAAQYDSIANLEASSRGSFAITGEAKAEKVIERLKEQAAKLGANGVLLHGVGSQAGASVGAEFTTPESAYSSYGLGVGISTVLHRKAGSGVAIYVEPK